MADFYIKGQAAKVDRVVKLREGEVDRARKTALKDGADNVFFTIGRDTYVASGRGMALDELKVGDAVTHNDSQGDVIVVDDEVNTAVDGLKAFWPPVVGLSGFSALLFAIEASFLAPIAAAAVPGLLTLGAVSGATKKVDFEALEPFVER